MYSTAAGVPFVAAPPQHPRPDAPVVVAWHLLDAPRTETAFAAALPLAGLDAWRIHLGLPLCGSRSPGPDALMALAAQDAVRLVWGPIAEQATAEFGPALGALREQLDLGNGPVSLVGGSLGAAVALSVRAAGAEVDAMVLVSPLLQLRPLVALMGEEYGTTYAWDAESDAIADRLDFVARAAELGDVPVRLVVGTEDSVPAFRAPAEALCAALPHADLVLVEGMGHALAEEPGLDPAPQLPAAATVDTLAVDWLARSGR
jgi:pimeloyl-ACP methyl ester carboxylesterase